jgi:regulator of nucleoside diphosphate kinase
MTLTVQSASVSRKTAAITLDAAQADQLEALAAGALRRSPALADKLLGEIARARIVETERLPRESWRSAAR